MTTSTRLPRLSLPLTDRDYADLEAISSSPESLRELGEDLAPGSSKAAVAVAVFEEGLRSIKERMAMSTYAAMGADIEEQREAQAERRRRERRGRDVEGD